MQSFFLGFCTVVVSLSIFSLAKATTVENEIHVKASTGGNQAGSVQEGTSKAEVFVETMVDGQVVEHVEERKVEESANPVEIEVHTQEALGSEEKSKSFFAAVVEFFRSILNTLFFA